MTAKGELQECTLFSTIHVIYGNTLTGDLKMKPNNRLNKNKLYQWLKKNCPEVLLEDLDELLQWHKAEIDHAYAIGYNDGFNDRGIKC